MNPCVDQEISQKHGYVSKTLKQRNLVSMPSKDVWSKIWFVVGCCFLLLPTGIQWYWSNLGSYVFSFLHKHYPTVTGDESRWLTSTFLVTRITSLIGTGFLSKHWNEYWIIVIGIVVFNAGMCLSYYAIGQSVVMLTFTLGGVCGIGTGILYSSALDISMRSAGNHAGLIVALIQSSYTFGAIVTIQAMTMYINPRNLEPDKIDDHYAFFSQNAIVSRVPYIFLIFGLSFLMIQSAGILLIWVHRSKYPKKGEEESLTSDSDHTQDGVEAPKLYTCNEESLTPQAFTVREVLRKRSFYIIWMTHMFGNYPYLIITNDFKAYGQLHIDDDHFLSALGTGIVIVSVLMKIIYGIISDRVGFRVGLISVFSCMTISCAFMYSAPLKSRWLYFLDVLLLAMPSGTILTSHTIAVVQLFGRQGVAVTTGIMSSGAIVMLFAAPPLMHLLLELGGWWSVFTTGAGISVFALILVVLFL